jgi:hypothetical protein
MKGSMQDSSRPTSEDNGDMECIGSFGRSVRCDPVRLPLY